MKRRGPKAGPTLTNATVGLTPAANDAIERLLRIGGAESRSRKDWPGIYARTRKQLLSNLVCEAAHALLDFVEHHRRWPKRPSPPVWGSRLEAVDGPNRETEDKLAAEAVDRILRSVATD